MSARTDAAAALVTQRNRLETDLRDLTDHAAALVTAENAASSEEAPP